MQEDLSKRQEALATPNLKYLEKMSTDIRELLERAMLAEAVVRFVRLRPPDQADVMAQLPRKYQTALWGRLTPNSLSTIIEELGPKEAVGISQSMEPSHLSQVLDQTSPDVAADILRGLPESSAYETL